MGEQITAMSSYEAAYRKIVGSHEGGYANDPDDKGGETYRGIARNFNPHWDGWHIIDSYKSQKNFPLVLDVDPVLQVKVMELYKPHYWDCFWGDMLNSAVAAELFDIHINTGRGIEFFQRTVNLLNKKEKLYPNIKVDGKMGNQTFSAYRLAGQYHGVQTIINLLNGFQVKHYIELMEKNETYEKYLGWFKRVEIKWSLK